MFDANHPSGPVVEASTITGAKTPICLVSNVVNGPVPEILDKRSRPSEWLGSVADGISPPPGKSRVLRAK
jgi:hypothetical protein